jgi:hypothetical protein
VQQVVSKSFNFIEYFLDFIFNFPKPSFAPDGFGIGTGIAEIRAERNGQGNGRVYSITFEANDGRN